MNGRAGASDAPKQAQPVAAWAVAAPDTGPAAAAAVAAEWAAAAAPCALAAIAWLEAVLAPPERGLDTVAAESAALPGVPAAAAPEDAVPPETVPAGAAIVGAAAPVAFLRAAAASRERPRAAAPSAEVTAPALVPEARAAR